MPICSLSSNEKICSAKLYWDDGRIYSKNFLESKLRKLYSDSDHKNIIHLFAFSLPVIKRPIEDFFLFVHWKMGIIQEQFFQLFISELFIFWSAKLVSEAIGESINQISCLQLNSVLRKRNIHVVMAANRHFIGSNFIHNAVLELPVNVTSSAVPPALAVAVTPTTSPLPTTVVQPFKLVLNGSFMKTVAFNPTLFHSTMKNKKIIWRKNVFMICVLCYSKDAIGKGNKKQRLNRGRQKNINDENFIS